MVDFRCFGNEICRICRNWLELVHAASGQTGTTESTDGRRRRCRTSPADAVAGYRGQLCRTRMTDLKEPEQQLQKRRTWHFN